MGDGYRFQPFIFQGVVLQGMDIFLVAGPKINAPTMTGCNRQLRQPTKHPCINAAFRGCCWTIFSLGSVSKISTFISISIFPPKNLLVTLTVNRTNLPSTSLEPHLAAITILLLDYFRRHPWDGSNGRKRGGDLLCSVAAPTGPFMARPQLALPLRGWKK